MDLKRLKRFDPEKREQLEGFLQWVQLMGLTGKDLVSLGGHIDRMQAREVSIRNREIVDNMGCQPIGKSQDMIDRWKLVTPRGTYWFEENGWNSRVSITSLKTKIKKTFNISDYELGRMHWRKHLRYRAMLDVHSGKILLDF